MQVLLLLLDTLGKISPKLVIQNYNKNSNFLRPIFHIFVIDMLIGSVLRVKQLVVLTHVEQIGWRGMSCLDKGDKFFLEYSSWEQTSQDYALSHSA